jgi:hypothetical protein
MLAASISKAWSNASGSSLLHQTPFGSVSFLEGKGFPIYQEENLEVSGREGGERKVRREANANVESLQKAGNVYEEPGRHYFSLGTLRQSPALDRLACVFLTFSRV